MKIAIIMTCFNRKNMTLNCLDKLYHQQGEYDIDVFICDDASNDGTFEVVKTQYPEVYIFQSQGNLYWCRGMYAAMSRVANSKHDFYLMVNDDVDFETDMLKKMLSTYKKAGEKCGIVGVVCSKDTNEISYGGKQIVPFSFMGFKFGIRTYKLIQPNGSEQLQKCDVANWNCFLIDSEILNDVGLIDNKYAHSVGDYDYSLRMKKKGYSVYVTQETVGYCENNSKLNTYRDHNTPRKKRIKQLIGPKGMPIGTSFRFAWKFNKPICILLMLVRYFQFFRCILFKKDI